MTGNAMCRKKSWLFTMVLTLSLTLLSCGGGTPAPTPTPTSAHLVSIAVTPGGLSLAPKSTQQFTAIGTYDDGSSKDLTNTVAWSSTSNAAIGTGGLATAVKPGNATITAALSGIAGIASLTITNPLVSVAITPANPTIQAGQKLQLTTMGTYYDGTTSVVTTGVLWSSSNADAISVDNTGMAQGVTAGRGVISASVGSISNSTSLITIVSPTAGVARFAYVTGVDGTLSGYTVNTTSGQIRANGYVLTGKNPTQVEVDPLGRFVFVTNPGDSTVSAYKIDSVSGALTPVMGSPFAVGAGFGSLVVDPSGTFLYIANGKSVSGFSIDSQTGALMPLSGSPYDCYTCLSADRLSIDPSGNYLYVTDQESWLLFGFAIGRTNGVLTSVPGSPFATGSAPTALPTAVVVEPTGNYVYVANGAPSALNGPTSVSGYSINASNGTLTPLTGSPYPTGGGFLIGITTDPLGKSLYVANARSNSISGFTIGSTGTLAAISGSPFAVDASPQSVRIDPTGTLAFVSNSPANAVAANEIETFSIAPSGALSSLKRMRTHPGAYSLALDIGATAPAYVPKFLYTGNLGNNISAYTIDSKTGALTETAGSPYQAGAVNYSAPGAIAADPSGRFVYDENGSISGFSVDVTNGTLTSLPGSPFAAGLPISFPFAIAADPSGRFLYVASTNPNIVSGYSINQSTGVLSALSGSPYPGGFGPTGVAVDPTGQFIYVGYQGGSPVPGVSAYNIDPTSGALTPLSGFMYPQGNASNNSIVIDPSGRFVYASDGNGDVIYEFAINPDGTWTQIGTATPRPFANFPMNIEPTGRFLYFPNGPMYSIDQLTGILTQISGSYVGAIVPDPSGRFGYAVNAYGNGVFSFGIDPNTGALTPVTGSLFGSLRASTLTVTGAIH